MSLIVIGRTAVKNLVQNHSSRKWQRQDFNSGSPTLSHNKLCLSSKPDLYPGDHHLLSRPLCVGSQGVRDYGKDPTVLFWLGLDVRPEPRDGVACLFSFSCSTYLLRPCFAKMLFLSPTFESSSPGHIHEVGPQGEVLLAS